jgi:hypothetical protein
MSVLVAPFLAGALLLVVAGVGKALDPGPTARAAGSAGLPFQATLPMVRLLGAGEVVVGGLALLVGGVVPAVLVSLSYAAFAVFVARGLMRGDLESCGCFSGDDAPPSVLHVVVNLFLALAALHVAVVSAPGVVELVTAGRSTAAAVGAVALLDAGAVYLVLTRMPRPLQAAAPAASQATAVDDRVSRDSGARATA